MINPTDAHGSILMQYLNPMEYDPVNPNDPQPFCLTVACEDGLTTQQHVVAKGGAPLTQDEIYLFILSADMGAQYCSRENLTGSCKTYQGP